MPESLQIAIRPRIHVGLLSMHGGGYRKNGGIGFAVEDPKTFVEVSRASEFAVSDNRKNPLTRCERALIGQIVDSVQQVEGFKWSVSCRLTGDARPHVGLGMGTGVRLAILESIYRLNGVEPDADLLVRRSGRGGTSGIGIRTYFHGGMVVDLGVRNHDQQFLPSSTGRPGSPPPVLAHTDMPAWAVCLCLPMHLRPRTQAEEREFFRRTTPISKISAYETTYHALFGVYAAAMEENLEAFCKAIDHLQTVEWKLQERKQYGTGVEDCTAKLKNCGMVGIGMSSLGPLLYCFGSKFALAAAERYMLDAGCLSFVTSPANCGRSLLEV